MTSRPLLLMLEDALYDTAGEPFAMSDEAGQIGIAKDVLGLSSDAFIV